MSDDLQGRCDDLSRMILASCKRKNLCLACAESLTGGLVADAFVRIPGASEVFLGSIVAYDSAAKSSLLSVDDNLLAAQGAVHPQVAEQMALGAAKLYSQQNREAAVLGISTTGVAGPGPEAGKPEGLVYLGLAIPMVLVKNKLNENVREGYCLCSVELRLQGSREAVRRSTVLQLLRRVFQLLNG